MAPSSICWKALAGMASTIMRKTGKSVSSTFLPLLSTPQKNVQYCLSSDMGHFVFAQECAQSTVNSTSANTQPILRTPPRYTRIACGLASHLRTRWRAVCFLHTPFPPAAIQAPTAPKQHTPRA